MLGEFVDEYTVRRLSDEDGRRLKQTGHPEMVVGWYHSHPRFGCWLSSVDINKHAAGTQMSLFLA